MTESVRGRGGRVEYSHERVVEADPQHPSLSSSALPQRPEWLRKTLGDEWFASIVYVDFGRRPITDYGIKPLIGMTELRLVYGDFRMVTDEGAKFLGQLRSLRTLSLQSNSLITDEGFGALAELKELWELDLTDTRISTHGLRKMRVQEMQELRWLMISNAKIDDEGVELLATLPRLNLLFLNDNPVTDVSIESLCRMKSLRTLSLMDTRISNAGIARLRQARPDLQVEPP